MVDKLINLLVVGVVLYVVYIIAGMIVSLLHLPALALTLVVVILLLVFVGYLLRLFDVKL